MASRINGSFTGCRLPDHQTRAGQNAILKGFNDASIYAAAQPQIIRIYDQVSQIEKRSAGRLVRAFQAPFSKNTRTRRPRS
jgi:hypothetical protein